MGSEEIIVNRGEAYGDEYLVGAHKGKKYI